MKNVPVKSPLPWWGLAPKTPVLSSDEVHVWCAELDQTASRVHNLQQTLDGNERTRAERFYFKTRLTVKIPCVKGENLLSPQPTTIAMVIDRNDATA